jgi:molybdopterin synthase catalytic subunit
VTIRVRVFASVREILGRPEISLEVPEGATAGSVLDRLSADYPRLQRLAPVLRLAVNREYAESGRVLAAGDEIALLPPVSGGADQCADQYEVTAEPLDLARLVAAVTRNTSGAIASFLGVVREFARGRQVHHLEYDAYPEMATATMRQIGEEIRARWPVDGVAIVHRTGRLTIGEASVAIAIASPHRHEALQACGYAIERLKEIVPIWKREVWADGAEWIGSTVEEYQERRREAGGSASGPLGSQGAEP